MNWKATTLVASTALLLVAAGATADTDTYKVKRLSYLNLGAYTARAYLRWNTDDGRKCEVRISGKLAFSEAAIVRLDEAEKFNFLQATDKVPCLDDNSKLPEGTEVWLKYRITSGETKSCRKDDKKFEYHKDGTGVRFDSGGETLTNNRCRIFSDLDTKKKFLK